MPRRFVLSAAERENLLALPDTQDGMIRIYSFSEKDLSIIRQHRGQENRLGFAIQLCYMRYPGMILDLNAEPSHQLLNMVAEQLKSKPDFWEKYGKRPETRREHLLELQSIFGFQSFSMNHYQPCVKSLDELAWQTDKGM